MWLILGYHTLNKIFIQVWDYTCFGMVINDNEHMSNHPAIFRPVSAKNKNSAKNGWNPTSVQNLLET